MAATFPNATKASPNFTWAELLKGQSAPPEVTNALVLLANRVLEPLRAKIATRLGPTKAAIRVNSGYRSPERNAATPGSSSTSQHMTGEAADIAAVYMASPDVMRLLWDSPEIPVDQVILYAPERGGHVHVSTKARGTNRRQFLYAPAGSTGYVAWSPPSSGGSSGSSGSSGASSGGGKAPTSAPTSTPKASGTPFEAALDASRKGLIWTPGGLGLAFGAAIAVGAAYVFLR